MSNNKLISVSKASKILGIHINTLKRWEKEGAISPIRVGPRRDRKYYENEILQILDEGRKTKKPYGTKYPYIAVATVLFHDNHIMLGKRTHSFAKGQYSLIGGYLPFGESFEEASINEVLEETKIKISNPKLICITNNVYKNTGHHSITIGMYKELPEKITPKANNEVEKWEWFAINNLPSPLLMADTKIISCLQNNSFYRK